MMGPCALEIVAGDFALAGGHGRIAVSLLAATLNSAAAFSIAVTPSGASTVPSHASYWQSYRRSSLSAAPVSGFLAMPAVSAASYVGSIRL
jgi:hypothetical protein